MKKIFSLILLSLVALSGFTFAQKQERPSGPSAEEAEPGQRPPRGERPPRRGPRGEGRGPERGEGRGRGPRPTEIGESEAELGASGIAWYPILEDGLAEAKRSNKPIIFMAVASQCSGISGVF